MADLTHLGPSAFEPSGSNLLGALSQNAADALQTPSQNELGNVLDIADLIDLSPAPESSGDSPETLPQSEAGNIDYIFQPGFDGPLAMQITCQQSGYHIGHDGKILLIFVSILFALLPNHQLIHPMVKDFARVGVLVCAYPCNFL